MDVTRKFHFASYAAISPERPEVSQAGRTVCITGGSSGIGLGISKSFARAGAAHIVILGRRMEVLEQAKHELLELGAAELTVSVYQCDVFEWRHVAGVWDTLAEEGVEVDTLVLNASHMELQPQGLADPKFVASVWSNFQGVVDSSLRFVDRFVKQGKNKPKALINISSAAAHLTPMLPGQFGYTASKLALASLLQGIADSVKAEDVQIVSIHPGGVLTEGAIANGQGSNVYPWNDAQLCGDFVLWAASKEASFLHGRFLWCQWDVEELHGLKEKFEQDPTYCRVGLQGPAPVEIGALYGQVWEAAKKMGRGGT